MVGGFIYLTKVVDHQWSVSGPPCRAADKQVNVICIHCRYGGPSTLNLVSTTKEDVVVSHKLTSRSHPRGDFATAST